MGRISDEIAARSARRMQDRAAVAAALWKPRSRGTRSAPEIMPPADLPADVAADEARAVLAGVVAATVYTDGACEPNPGPGGWGVLIRAHGLPPVELYGGDPSTTNNRMELTGALRALDVLPTTCATTIISDSQYVVRGAAEWLANWRRKGFKRDGADMPNADLWRALDAVISARPLLAWKWTRGHADNPYNARADALAAQGIPGAAR